jgi:hypothetical protein
MNKLPKIVQCPDVEGLIDLTPGRNYEVVSTDGVWNKFFGYYFEIFDDELDKRGCIEKKCAHLNKNNWIIIERES